MRDKLENWVCQSILVLIAVCCCMCRLIVKTTYLSFPLLHIIQLNSSIQGCTKKKSAEFAISTACFKHVAAMTSRTHTNQHIPRRIQIQQKVQIRDTQTVCVSQRINIYRKCEEGIAGNASEVKGKSGKKSVIQPVCFG